MLFIKREWQSMKAIQCNDGWTVSETEFNIDNNRKFEGLFTIGSGYLHIRGSLEEHIANAGECNFRKVS